MKQSDHYRENAENCQQLAERAIGEASMKRYLRMAAAWTALANEQDWLDGENQPEKNKLEPPDTGLITGY